MLKLLSDFRKKRQLKRYLLPLYEEMKKNLEIFYVMDQRQFITSGFHLVVWPLVKDLEAVKKHETITVYARALDEFNRLFKQQKEYEQWYISDLKNKTPDNARVLHSLKNDLDQKLKVMEAIIIPAGQALETELLQLGFITN